MSGLGFAPGESIGGSGTCFGSYKWLGGSSAYKVDVPLTKKVWIWQGPAGFEPNGGWVSLTQRSADPAEQKTCEVLDYSNWACTDSDHGPPLRSSSVDGSILMSTAS
jgi:hypothetical protein